ncbi:MAG TPA: hypothetical protein VG265_09895 [Gaiellaceae bacterium]|jgi:uncharacterized alkaline shock family protein YloU|nr:hypothetical protein [Gaiellaceae bacterium]
MSPVLPEESLMLPGENGTVSVPERVLVAIASRAAETVDGIRVRRRRTIDLEAHEVRLSVAARRGEPLRELAERAQSEVASALESMCGFEARVDIAVRELE